MPRGRATPEPEERITAAEAQKLLGISNRTMARLLKESLLWELDPLDKRVKMVRRADVERLKAASTKPGKEAA
jgi:hypothetical protein